MSKVKSIYYYLIIIVITYLVYSNSISGEFVFDDESVIVNNPSIQSLGNIPKYFTADEGFHKVIGRYYRPVVSSSYAVDYSVWGLNPYGFHITNVIIHIISCLLLFKIFIVLFWRYKYRNLFSLFAALIFAVHPIHTEAVAWISGRTDSMVTMFFLASFLFYIEFTKEQRHVNETNTIESITDKNYLYLALSLVFYTFGLLTKEMIVTMPVIILLYDFIYRKKPITYFKKNILIYSLFGGITLVYLILRYMVLKDIPERENYLYFLNKDFVVTFGTMLKTIPVYFRLLFAPFGLIYHYNGVILDAKTLIDPEVVFTFLFIVLLIFLSIYYYKKDSIISFCILFFFVTLLPVMNIFPTMNLMAERFLYLTSFALVLLICHIALLGSAKRDFTILTVGLFVIVCAFSYLTIERNTDWQNNNSLYSSAKGNNGTVILVNEGNILANSGQYDQAAKLYKQAIEIREYNVLAHHNLGLVYLLKGELDSAEMRFKRGVFVDSLAPDGYFQLATVYNMKGRKDDAIKMLEKLQTVAPNYKESAAILQSLKSGERSDMNLLQGNEGSEESKKYKIQMLQQRSYKLYTDKKFEEAIRDLEELISINEDPPTKSGYLNNIAMCYGEMKNTNLEEKFFLEALSADSTNINALNGLSGLYLKKDDREKAKEYLEKVLSIKSDDENARNKLDSLNKF